MQNLQTGKIGEEMAAAYLEAAGYRILERNYRCPFGEIDIIAQEGDTLVFVEVKSRRSENYGLPQLAVGPEKQRRISKISLFYLQSHRLEPSDVRFDVVAILLRPKNPSIELIKDAFELAYGR
ncbi:YraN family protein [Syntrophus gentianae]|nr:YraN family protein [Syntrophus gentianae]